MSDQTQSSTDCLIRKIREGHESRFTPVFELYLARLTNLVRSRMAAKLSRKIDPEDVVLSAFRSFFVATRDGRFEIENESALWQLLVTISLRKLGKQLDYFNAAKRSIERESGNVTSLMTAEPTVEEAAMIEEELCLFLGSLTPQERRVTELRLQGMSQDEIANQINISERTVRRILKTITDGEMIYQGGLTIPQLRIAKEILASSTASIHIPSNLQQFTIDKFLIQRHVGSGGMGKVYLATHRQNKQTVAIKFLRKRFLTDQRHVQNFLNEAAILQQLDHPNIVKFWGMGKIEHQGLFLVMEWIESVKLISKSNPHLTTQKVINICRQASSGLLEAHQAGVIHCDVTPANLLRGSNGKVVITDFGLARRTLERLTINTGTAGTAAFLSPEQVTSEWGEISPKTDVYGLAATMYYLLTGTVPFPAQSIPEMLSNVISSTMPRPPAESRPEIGKQLNQLCMRCLQKEPNDRPEMQVVLECLQGMTAEQGNDTSC